MGWLQRWRRRRECFHHDPHTGRTWIRSELIDMGSKKRFWCAGVQAGVVGCGKQWFT